MAMQTDNPVDSNGMPFLENSLPAVLPDVDDLFGGEVPVNLALSPPTKELRQRIDDIRRRGCCQTVAWSKAGIIASLTPDGHFVELRFLRCNPDDGSWQLSEPTRCDLVVGSDSIPLAHLAWSSTAIPELAILDSVGRLALLTFSNAINRPYLTRRWDPDPIDDLNAVVGCHWLSLMPPSRQFNVLHGPAIKDSNRYRYDTSFIHSFGPFHPNPSKSSLLCVTTNGQLKLFYSQSNNRIEETTIDIERIGSTDDMITHASICTDKNFLYLILATASRQLRLVKLTLQWGPSQGDKQPISSPLSPTIVERHLASTSWHQYGPNDSAFDAAMTQVSHLEILPSTLENDAQSWSPPLILTVRSYLPSPDSPYPEAQSIIDRWQVLTDQPQTIHPAFSSLGGQKQNSVPDIQPTTRLQRGEPLTFNKVIVGLQILQFGKVICVAFSDGTVEYRDRLTLSEIYNEPNTERIMNPHQVGFAFPDPTPCLQLVLSPTNCSLVQITPDGELIWKYLQYAQGDIGNSTQDPQYSPVIAALTVATGAAIYYVSSFDDVLAVARPFADKKRFTYDFANDVVSMLKITVDYSEDSHHDNLVRNTHLQMCLSIIGNLGFHGQYDARTFGSKFATLALNARNIVILVTIASNTPPNLREKFSPLDEPEVVEALAGCAKWSIDLLSWLADCLFSLLDDPKFTSLVKDQSKFAAVSAYLQEKNDVALHLLLCSSTRGLLVAVCRRLQHLDTLGNRVIGYWETQQAQADGKAPNLSLHRAYQRMQQITSSSLVKAQEFEKLLTQLGADIRSTYSTMLTAMVSKAAGQPPPQAGAAISKHLDAAVKQAQMQCELGMLLGGTIHPMFRKALGQLFANHLAGFKVTVDPAKLFFHDYSLLEVAADSPESFAKKRAEAIYVDMFRKVEITPGQTEQQVDGGRVNGPVWSGQWRRCVRCASVMEDVSSPRPGFSYVLTQQRKCACGGSWGLLPKGELIS
ncbi:hypothetical protein jhhlp_007179 [Lomentospora prolificans]|uniref:Mediator of RNA polymerase II transcription subunit 16 n=1 Tax=Lomentospora prolificans TaxID=41688 RepID=A0A2N3N1X9_9PEZI|nr:hypothetical protein jhhlp_007179 [Lomentospora prolificans]